MSAFAASAETADHQYKSKNMSINTRLMSRTAFRSSAEAQTGMILVSSDSEVQSAQTRDGQL